MSSVKKMSGMAIASAAAALFLSGCDGAPTGSDAGNAVDAASSANEAEIHCVGINACKGHSGCATADSSCKGQNSCKGKGWLPMSETECESEGGTVG